MQLPNAIESYPERQSALREIINLPRISDGSQKYRFCDVQNVGTRCNCRNQLEGSFERWYRQESVPYMLDIPCELILVHNPIEELLILTNRAAQACKARCAADDVQGIVVPEDDGCLAHVGARRRFQCDAGLALTVTVALAKAGRMEGVSSSRLVSDLSLRTSFNNADDVVTRTVLVIEGRVVHVHLDLLIQAVFEMEIHYACRVLFGGIFVHGHNKAVLILSGRNAITKTTALKCLSIWEEEHRREFSARPQNCKVWSQVDQAIAQAIENLVESLLLLLGCMYLLLDLALGQPLFSKVRFVTEAGID